jgi:hypothetical protein
VLYQLSYTPRLRHRLYPGPGHDLRVGRFAMPALFTVLTLAFVVIAVSSARHGRWVIAVPTVGLGLWMASLAFSAARRGRR